MKSVGSAKNTLLSAVSLLHSKTYMNESLSHSTTSFSCLDWHFETQLQNQMTCQAGHFSSCECVMHGESMALRVQLVTLSVTLWASTFCRSRGSGAWVSLASVTQCQGLSVSAANSSEITWRRLSCITSYSQMRSWWLLTLIHWLSKVENF